MKMVAFITDFGAVDRIIDHLKLTFVADRPPPPQVAYQEVLMAAETSIKYFSSSSFMPEGEVRVIFAHSGTGDGCRAALPRTQAVFDRF